MLPDLTVEKRTTVERVAQVLRDEILGGGIAPGTALREAEIASTTGVSRGSVRQAFSLLVNEGLLSHSSYRSVSVTTLDERDIREIFHARRMIELAAVEATREATPAQIAKIREASDAFVAAIDAGDRNRSHHADVGVHVALVETLRSGRMSRVHAGLMSELRLALTAQYESPPDGAALVRRHREFIQLLTEGHIDEAREQLAHRLHIAERRLLEVLATGATRGPS